MKLTKTKLKEIVREIMSEDIMDKQIKNPKTGNKIKVRTALQLPGEHPANKMAKKLVAKSPIKKDKTDIDVGGPAYPNVPKGAKSSKQAKVIKQNDSTAEKINPNVSSGKELIMRGMADDIAEFMEEIPDAGQDFDTADELINFIRDNEQGMRDDDDDVIEDYKKDILRILNTPGKSKNESIRETKKMAKLKDILSEAFEDRPQIDKYKVVEGVKNFGIVGKQLYNNNNIVEIAKQLSEVAESAHHHILGEQDDWFDKISINKNMKSLKGSVVEFQKTAKEAQAINQRLTALYEDMGHVLNRYYDIDEAHVYGHDDEDSEVEEKLDKVDPSKVEPEDDFKDREDKDIDNDGDVDDSDEYLHKKRQAISKAVKSTKESLDKRPTKRLSDINSVSGIPSLGDMIRKK